MKKIVQFAYICSIMLACAACSSASAQQNKVTPISDAGFIKTLGSGIAVVDFWATWCRPCLTQAPIFEQTADEIGNKAQFFKMDVDNNKTTAAKYNIKSIPTIIVFKNGKEIKRLVGMTDKATLLKEIKSTF